MTDFLEKLIFLLKCSYFTFNHYLQYNNSIDHISNTRLCVFLYFLDNMSSIYLSVTPKFGRFLPSFPLESEFK